MKMLKPENSLLLVVDIQQAFVPVIHEIEKVIQRAGILIQAARLLEIPVLCSEQYPQGLGATVPQLQEVLGDCPRREKTAFSCAGDEKLLAEIKQQQRPDIVVAGIETHVCVAQTVLDLLEKDYRCFIPVDAVSSRKSQDAQIALERLRDNQAVLTTSEAIIFEWLGTSRHPHFKTISRLIR